MRNLISLLLVMITAHLAPADHHATKLAALAEHDRAVHVLDTWMRDPYIVTGPDGAYYLTGTQPNRDDPRWPKDRYNSGLDNTINKPGSPPSIVGSQVRFWRSEDLAHWEELPEQFTMDKGYWAEAMPDAFETVPNEDWRLWAPEVSWHHGKAVVVHTSPAPVQRGANLAVSADAGLSGPFTHPMGELMRGRHDPSLYTDTADGTVYLLWGNTSIAPLKPDFSGFAKEPVRIDPSDRIIGHEGATMAKIGDKYVHFGTAWSTDELRKGTYNLYYTTADHPMGPYGPRQFAGRFLGHGTPFQDKEGRWWCTAFYNANVPPLDVANIASQDLGHIAHTINEQGVTLVPLDVRVLAHGEIYIRAKDPRYALPGPDETQDFGLRLTDHEDPEKYVRGRWTNYQAQTWYDAQPWLVGTNFYPSNAINQIEMWQAETWDEATIDRELGWSAELGMNTHRVYLHDLVWAQDPDGLYARMDRFLELCAKHGIRPSFVFFDDCHAPDAFLGEQPLPVPGYHNSGWVNSPARELAVRYSQGNATADEIANLKGYVQGTLSRFADDPRVLMWELYNEPGRGRIAADNGGAMGDHSNQLLLDAWAWAREIVPSQPICSTSLGSLGERNIAIGDANSDIMSFHGYGPAASFTGRINTTRIAAPGRPIICTEYMARTAGSTFEAILPILHRERIGAINWGFVAGKSGTIWPWSSRQGVDVDAERAAGNVTASIADLPEPDLWFHDVLRPDGTPYHAAETDLIKRLTGVVENNLDTVRASLAAHDRAVHIHDQWIRDPYIYLHDDGYYYLTGTTLMNEADKTVTISLWRSLDLADWEKLPHLWEFADTTWIDLDQPVKHHTGQLLVWAPEIYRIGDQWAIVHTTNNRFANILRKRGPLKRGDWEEPMGADFGPRHDPAIYVEDDGTPWLLWGVMNLQKLKPDLSGFVGDVISVAPANRSMGHEGSYVIKVGQKYVWFGTGWSTDTMRHGTYNLYYATADSLTGPYGDRRFVGRFLGHGTPFQDKQGRWWTTAFHNANVPTIDPDEAPNMDLSDTAYTINRQGTTLVPLDITTDKNGEVWVRAKDPHYASPGAEEVQQFE